MMSTGLSFLGLTVSAAGSLWLLAFDIKERERRSVRTMELASLKNQIEAWQRGLKESVRNLNEVNKRLDPNHLVPYPAENVDKRTEYQRKKIGELQQKLDSLQDINAKVLEDLLPLVHPIAFGLLALGFVLQGIGLLL